MLLIAFEGFYLLNVFEAWPAKPPVAESPEGGRGLFNWKSWMKYPETHSLEVTSQKGSWEGILRQQSFRNIFSSAFIIFRERENLKSLSSLGDFPREDNFRKFSL